MSIDLHIVLQNSKTKLTMTQANFLYKDFVSTLESLSTSRSKMLAFIFNFDMNKKEVISIEELLNRWNVFGKKFYFLPKLFAETGKDYDTIGKDAAFVHGYHLSVLIFSIEQIMDKLEEVIKANSAIKKIKVLVHFIR